LKKEGYLFVKSFLGIEKNPLIQILYKGIPGLIWSIAFLIKHPGLTYSIPK